MKNSVINKFKNIPHINNNKVILFDGECNLCNTWVKFIRHYDENNTFKLASMQSSKGKDILAYINRPIKDFETMLLINNNLVYDKSTAVLHIIQAMPFPIKSLSILKHIPLFFRDFIYTLIAKYRYKLFEKDKTCDSATTIHDDKYL